VTTMTCLPALLALIVTATVTHIVTRKHHILATTNISNTPEGSPRNREVLQAQAAKRYIPALLNTAPLPETIAVEKVCMPIHW